ncbi:MAG: DUF4157 domain-containing protein [Pseudomonadota bacterium]
MPDTLRTGLERLSGIDLSEVRVHRNSPKPAALNAHAYTQGQSIHLAPNQQRHLPHEGWHVVQQLQGRVRADSPAARYPSINSDPGLEAEADRMGSRAANLADPAASQLGPPLTKMNTGAQARQPIQREVRINNGRTRVNEADYLPGGPRNNIGSRHSVATMIGDGVRRVFQSTAELEAYANGQVDFIGDVQTSGAGDYWYRLPENDLMVLGERHQNASGNVEDVISGLRTSRFMYEPFHEFTGVSPLGVSQIGGGTEARMRQVESGLRSGSMVDRTNFDPHLENIVIKALTGTTVARNHYIDRNPARMTRTERNMWRGRPSIGVYSFSERIALYLSFAIHIASDVSQYSFPQPSGSNYVTSARRLAEYYRANRRVLDEFMHGKDRSQLVGMYELTKQNKHANLPVLRRFSVLFHEYGSRYIEQLGRQVGNPALQARGAALSRNPGAGLGAFSPVREDIIWARVQHANSNRYLIVGMGDAHRQNLQTRLNAAGIPHKEVAQSLTEQEQAVLRNWVP